MNSHYTSLIKRQPIRRESSSFMPHAVDWISSFEQATDQHQLFAKL